MRSSRSRIASGQAPLVNSHYGAMAVEPGLATDRLMHLACLGIVQHRLLTTEYWVDTKHLSVLSVPGVRLRLLILPELRWEVTTNVCCWPIVQRYARADCWNAHQTWGPFRVWGRTTSTCVTNPGWQPHVAYLKIACLPRRSSNTLRVPNPPQLVACRRIRVA